MKIKRIMEPTFKCSLDMRLTLNQTEVRQLILDVAEGKRDHGFRIYRSKFDFATVLDEGRFSRDLEGWGQQAHLARKRLIVCRKI